MSEEPLNGREYRDEEWPHGLRCIDCMRLFADGDRFSERLESFMDDVPILHIICLDCALAGQSS